MKEPKQVSERKMGPCSSYQKAAKEMSGTAPLREVLRKKKKLYLWWWFILQLALAYSETKCSDRSPTVFAGMSNMFSSSLIQPDAVDLNTHSQFTARYPFLSTLNGESIYGLQVTEHGGVTNTEALSSANVPLGNQENFFAGGTSLLGTSVANLLASRSGLHENLNQYQMDESLNGYQVDDLRTLMSNNCGDTSNSSFANSMNCGYGVQRDIEFFPSTKDAEMNCHLATRWDFNQLLGPQEFAEKSSVTVASSLYGLNIPSNELSLTLSTQQPSIVNLQNIPDQCSEISCSGVTHDSIREITVASKQNASNSKGLTMGFSSYRSVQLSDILSGSKYFHAVQQILTEIAHYSIGNLETGMGIDPKFSLSGGTVDWRISSNRSDQLPYSSGEIRTGIQINSNLQKQDSEEIKAHLLSLLQMVDSRYNQCLDEIHTVVSAFHAATELDPQMHARFAVQSVSHLYRNLRGRIANQILRAGECHSSGLLTEKHSLESSFLQKQWALQQQLKRKDHQSWRPQRGLPERSVSVLRAWLFQNFLHPYPRDAEKHLLAIRSGLTRNQVSNWFINARVRLWKPMIEEMYTEVNARNGLPK
ncbi:hypothetical protein C5167_018414 [Papaver somniferum]|uniref:Homeobox domain-containing protein n=1 Tax=Papaver somniferum TaxID=3469 RepID=A0A4Y7IQB0_PAPSO|nr:hypothetical protein C5167_018414 [Papaver somniferum]